MAFEDLFVPMRDDQLSKLRCQKALQSPDPAQFLDLFGDPRFETSVQLCYLIGAFVQFADQPSVLHCDNRLRRKVFEQRNLLFGKRPRLEPRCNDHSEQLIAFSQRHRQ